MKLSVTLGIFQMTLGIFLRGINCVYFKEKLECVTDRHTPVLEQRVGW